MLLQASSIWRKLGCFRSPAVLAQSRLRGFLGGSKAYELPIEQEVVNDFQCSRDKEWRVDQRGPSKHESYKQWTDSGTGSSGHASDAGGCGSFFRANHSHGVGLPGRYIHLTDTETH